MTATQKVIKYLAISFAVFLIFTIVSAILGGIYGVVNIVGINKDKDDKEVQDINLDINDDTAYLSIDVYYTNVVIETGDQFLAKTNNKNIQCKQNGNKLVIKEKKKSWFSTKNRGELVITIPQDLKFEKVKINTGAGRLKIENINTDKLDFDLGAGETIIDNIVADSLRIDTGVGELSIRSGEINDFDFDMGVGSSDITAKLTGEGKISTGIGELDLNILGSKDNYEIKVNTIKIFLFFFAYFIFIIFKNYFRICYFNLL